jgi:hypothetical protein
MLLLCFEAEKTSDVDPIKLAFNKAKAYKESIESNSDLGVERRSGVGEENSVKESNALDGGKKDVSVSLKIAMEKAKKYKQNKGVEVSETNQGNTYGWFELVYLSLSTELSTCDYV